MTEIESVCTGENVVVYECSIELMGLLKDFARQDFGRSFQHCHRVAQRGLPAVR